MLHHGLRLPIIFLSLWGLAQADVFPECGDRLNIYLATGEGCSTYIFCNGEESQKGECDAEAPYFSEVDQTCDKDESVCKRQATALPGEIPNATTTTTAATTTTTTTTAATATTGTTTTTRTTTRPTTRPTPTTASSSSFESTTTSISSPRTTTTALSESTTSSSTMPTSTPTSLSTNSAAPVTTSISPLSTITTAANAAAQCPATDDPSHIVFMPHQTSCSDYFMCYHGEPMLMHCSHMLHFDVKSQKCDYPEVVKCQLDSASPREKCQSHTVDVYPYPTNCNYYYLCRFGFLMVMQCPLHMDWDYERKSCRLRTDAKCYHSPLH